MRQGLAAGGVIIAAFFASAAVGRPTVAELKARGFLDDYASNIVQGYDIVTETEKHASRYSGNGLRCSNCHLNAGTTPDALPLNVAGLYPKWRAKNGVRNGIGLRIRECFLYSHDGIMPPEDAPEVLAVAAYISYLSEGEIIGTPPKGWSVPTLATPHDDPNPANGKVVYQEKCAICHGDGGAGMTGIPPLWGRDSYNAGAGMNNVAKSAGFIWANMPLGQGRTLTEQQAYDVAAFLNMQERPLDPRDGKFLKLVEIVATGFTRIFRDAPTR